MTKSDFIHVLADAVQQHEGWLADSGEAWPNLNPGNLHMEGQPGASGVTGAEAKFSDFYSGKQAQLNDITAKLDAGLHNILEIITKYESGDPSNNVPAYITAVLEFFAARNITIGPGDDIDKFIASFNKPVILIAVNQIYAPADWAAIQAEIVQCAAYMPGFAFSCRYSNVDLVNDIVQSDTIISETTSVIDCPATINIIKPYNQGQTLNVMIYDGTVMQGSPSPAGGCEWQGGLIDSVSAISSVMYQGPAFVDSGARVIFHELIHELFTLTKQDDVLHADLIAGKGYAANAAVDLLACFEGNQLNTPEAVDTLEEEKAEI